LPFYPNTPASNKDKLRNLFSPTARALGSWCSYTLTHMTMFSHDWDLTIVENIVEATILGHASFRTCPRCILYTCSYWRTWLKLPTSAMFVKY